MKEVREKAKLYCESHSSAIKKNEKNQRLQTIADEEHSMKKTQELDGFKVQLQNVIANMLPGKFKQFSRALLTKIGVTFSDKGTKVSNVGCIGRYGYHIDEDDFRITRVVIQCKRYNENPVTEPEINQFLGSMTKFQVDYGVFITNSRFTHAAKDAAMQGKPITLIDGNDLIELVIKYKLFIKPVTTYVLDDLYMDKQD